MATTIYRSPDLADRIEALIATPPDDPTGDLDGKRTFVFEKIDRPSRSEGQDLSR